MLELSSLYESIEPVPSYQSIGRVVATKGSLILARIPQSSLGNLCYIKTPAQKQIAAQVMSFQEDLIALAPYDEMQGLSPGAEVCDTGAPPKIHVTEKLIGQILDSLGKPLLRSSASLEQSELCGVAICSQPPNPLERTTIDSILETGVRVVDSLCTLGYGQRIGLFASSGVGKSTLLGMLARGAKVDLTVIGLVGERGREVKDFIEHALGSEALAKSIVICATSDEPPLRRYLAAHTATAVAEYFRAHHKRVLLLIDSLTRVARAIRDLSLAAGEIPVRQGYTSSVYTQLPKLLERAGNDSRGSITAIYTVLTNPEQNDDPLGDEIKSLLDGHLVLDPAVMQRGIRPAVDPLLSVSRLMPKLHSAAYLKDTEMILKMAARLKKDKDLLIFGGTPDSELQAALELEDELVDFLTQGIGEKAALSATLERCSALAQAFREKRKQRLSTSDI